MYIVVRHRGRSGGGRGWVRYEGKTYSMSGKFFLLKFVKNKSTKTNSSEPIHLKTIRLELSRKRQIVLEL